jgi:uncharacterized membrane protein YkvI
MVPGIAATFIGTVVGAGFASGQEIYQFFSIHGLPGFWGVLLAIILLGIGGDKIFRMGCTLKPESYKDLLTYLLGSRLVHLADLFLFLFFTILIGVMFAGSGTIFKEMGLGYWTGIVITGLLLVLVLFRELPGLISANLVVIPLMFAGSIGISIYAICTRCATTTTTTHFNWILASSQFSAYNLILSVPVLLSLAKQYPFRHVLKLGSWLGSIGLGLMAGFIHWSIISHLPHLKISPLPMIDLAKSVGTWAYWAYALVLWGEMFTTLLANTYGVAQRLVSLTGWPFQGWVIILTLVGILIAEAGFINLIAGFYPLYGYVCLVILILVFVKKT